MSSILDALKKLEEEKAARRAGTGNIAGRVTSSRRPVRQRPAWRLPTMVGGAALIAAAITYGIMVGFSAKQAKVIPGSPNEAKMQVKAETIVPPVVTEKIITKNLVSEPLQNQPSRPAPVKAAAVPAGSVPQQTVRQQGGELPPKKDQQTAGNLPAPQPPSIIQRPAIMVSGIAWQQDSASRLAVVNGTSVAEGYSVEGAIVKEIRPDRVIFYFNRNEFEVTVGKDSH